MDVASEVEICNRALQHLGQARINAMDEPSKAARECAFNYPLARDALLEVHAWNFALKTDLLAADDAGRFPLPADLIKIDRVGDGGLLGSWRQEGRVILLGEATDAQSSSLRLRYVRRIEDPNDMPPLFREALAARIAEQLVETFAPSVNRAQMLERVAKALLADARWSDAQQAGIRRYEVVGPYEARYGGRYEGE